MRHGSAATSATSRTPHWCCKIHPSPLRTQGPQRSNGLVLEPQTLTLTPSSDLDGAVLAVRGGAGERGCLGCLIGGAAAVDRVAAPASASLARRAQCLRAHRRIGLGVRVNVCAFATLLWPTWPCMPSPAPPRTHADCVTGKQGLQAFTPRCKSSTDAGLQAIKFCRIRVISAELG